jgi:hypothetical protein
MSRITKRTTDLPFVDIKINYDVFVQTIHQKIKAQLEKLNYPDSEIKSLCHLVEQNLNQYIHDKFGISGKLVITQYPLGSLGASGKFPDADAGKIVFVRGSMQCKPYIRRWVKPPDPSSAAQKQHHIRFRQINLNWKQESEAVHSLWNMAARKYHPLSGQNLYIKKSFEGYRNSGHVPDTPFLPENT